MVSINFVRIFLFIFLQDAIYASPAKRSVRKLREVYPEIESPPETDGNQAQVCIVGDVVYGVDEIVPAEQPCLKCRCRPPGVQCETIRCAKKPGCKAIHKSNKCCPDYQCECNHEGQIYANGERLQSPPGGECQVCYCRGGEVQCTNVSCYIRTDCEGKTVAGQCCPKYDNCPPKDPNNIHNSVQPFSNYTEVLPVSPPKQIEQPQITIHEIIPETKEIVFTEEPSIVEIVQSENNVVTDSEPESSDIREVFAVSNDPAPESSDSRPFLNGSTAETVLPSDSSDIQEVLPSSSDIQEVQSNSSDTQEVEPDSSDIKEVFHHPPPVLRIGDKLLFLKEGELVADTGASTPAPVITIIGAEGLQRGEDSSEIHDPVGTVANDLETRATESHILSLVKRKNQKPPASTTTTELPTSTTLLPGTSSELPSSTSSTEDISTTEMDENATTEVTRKILQEVLEIRNNSTIPNTTQSEWLKSTTEETLINPRAVLPQELLRQKSDSDLEIEDEDPGEELDTRHTTLQPRSIETMEELASEESREVTTPLNHAQPLVTAESDNASVENATDVESQDMLKVDSNTQTTRIDDVEVFSSDESTTNVQNESTTFPNTDQVELITQPLPTKLIGKRESSKRDEEDEIFRQLNDELLADTTEKIQSEQEEKEESDTIFKELLEETSTPKPKKVLTREEETLQRVSDAIAKLTLRGAKPGLDTDLLKVISNFFSAQNKPDNSVKKDNNFRK